MYERVQIAEVAQIYELWNAYASTLKDGDIERWISLWTEDGIQMPPDTPHRVGKEKILKGMQPLFDLFDMSEMVVQVEEVQILGNKAYSHGSFTCTLKTKKSTGEIKHISGKFLDILEKQSDGTWRITIDCHNCNGPTE